ncbi:MAG: hypothetical protein VX223_07165, partial [Myxococcota bacterium]|nr:hypothetical protein [Myxococcota bacterium]
MIEPRLCSRWLVLAALVACISACTGADDCDGCSVPEAPRELSAWIEDGSISVAWSPVSGVSGYAVHLNDRLTASIAAPQTVALLRDVAPGPVRIRVQGVNVMGEAGAGVETEIVVPELGNVSWPDDASLSMTPLSNGAGRLEWSPALGTVTEYRVTQDLVDVGAVDGPTTSIDLANLVEGANTHFRVVAFDIHGEPVAGPSLTFIYPDGTSPQWSDAQLWIADTSGSIVTLAWTPAEDNVAVARYVLVDVESDGTPLTETPGTQHYCSLIDLAPGAVVNLRVEAEDALGNRSQGGPSLLVVVPDTLAPQFPRDAVLEVSGLSEAGATLTWTPAEDDVGVVLYRLFQDQVLVAETAETSATIPALAAGMSQDFYVQALDAAGNWSSDGPTLNASLEDTDGPVWPAGANLLVVGVSPTSVSLVWPTASDVVGVALYEVYVNGVLELGTTEQSVIVDGLSPMSTYALEVYALDTSGNKSPPLTSPATTSGVEPPSWGPAAELVVTEVGEDEVTVQWTPHPEAVLYRIRYGSVILAEVSAPTVEVSVYELDAASTYAFWLQVVDVHGLASLDGPVAQFETLDLTAPSWEPDAAIVVDQVTSSSVKLFWPKASDNVEVDDYLVSVDGVQLLVTDVTTATLEGLSGPQVIQLSVQARDKAGNVSTMALEVSVVIPPAILDTEDVFQGLSVTCGGCHSQEGPTGFFVSLSAFETLLMVPP